MSSYQWPAILSIDVLAFLLIFKAQFVAAKIKMYIKSVPWNIRICYVIYDLFQNVLLRRTFSIPQCKVPPAFTCLLSMRCFLPPFQINVDVTTMSRYSRPPNTSLFIRNVHPDTRYSTLMVFRTPIRFTFIYICELL